MLILVGPSASGKTEVVKLLIKDYNLQKLVTYTTRCKRIGEVDDVDYHFISKEDFLIKKDNGFFLEYVNYNGNFYATAYSDLANNKVVILEPSGVKTYLKKVPEKIKICYLRTPISYRKSRMIARGDDSVEIEKRILNDDLIFNESIEKVADWIIDSTDISVEDLTKEVYRLYKPFI